MFMPWPTSGKIFFSTQAGGGVPGITAGTGQDTTTEIGFIIPINPLSADISLSIGGIITGIQQGMNIAGNLSGDHIMTPGAIGMPGEKTGTGKNKTTALKK